MTTKEYLQQVGKLDKVINNKLIELAQLKEMSYSISAVSTGDRVKSSPNCDPIGTAQVKIFEMEREIDNLVDEYVDVKKEIIEKIEWLKNEKNKKMLYLKYIEFMSIHDIAKVFGMTDRGCKKLHNRALEEFSTQYIDFC